MERYYRLNLIGIARNDSCRVFERYSYARSEPDQIHVSVINIWRSSHECLRYTLDGPKVRGNIAKECIRQIINTWNADIPCIIGIAACVSVKAVCAGRGSLGAPTIT